MSRIRVEVDRLVLNGFDALEGRTLAAALQSQLSLVLADRQTRHEWARSHRTPVLKVAPVTRHAGTAGAAAVGRTIGTAVGRGLKP